MARLWCGYWCSLEPCGPNWDRNEPCSNCSIISGQCHVSIQFNLFIIIIINIMITRPALKILIYNLQSCLSRSLWSVDLSTLSSPIKWIYPLCTLQPNYYYSHKANLRPLPRGPGAEDERIIVIHNLQKKDYFVIVTFLLPRQSYPLGWPKISQLWSLCI